MSWRALGCFAFFLTVVTTLPAGAAILGFLSEDGAGASLCGKAQNTGA